MEAKQGKEDRISEKRVEMMRLLKYWRERDTRKDGGREVVMKGGKANASLKRMNSRKKQ